ncbi:predicted protein [Naegleria gruberi]|uniref:Predicted protein n=1 Tax=Naegleria gruberi TaxID=5762 RepID=D2VS72_NAEGR|nr:uncharacterized protein NAEGRDRAFT_51839 [Naegleria gruberi]EFC40290.1 predicted protein [Naegleria gruberi]|eukprot:XP_002673034.1 predicted protein [Naegleria gruberi strain NEG-M]
MMEDAIGTIISTIKNGKVNMDHKALEAWAIHKMIELRKVRSNLFQLEKGGVVIIKSMIEKWMVKGKDYESNFIQYLKNPEFQELLKNYCLKEMSSENFAIYMDLMKLDKEGKNSTMDLETLQTLEKDYFLANSMYEINISHAAKMNFYKLLNSAKQNEPPTVGELIEALLTDVVRNLYDTFSRLERTKEFKVWLEIYDIQIKNLLL